MKEPELRPEFIKQFNITRKGKCVIIKSVGELRKKTENTQNQNNNKIN